MKITTQTIAVKSTRHIKGGYLLLEYLMDNIDACASAVHSGWLESKQLDFEDPTNPFKGWGPERVRVGELLDEDLRELKISHKADPKLDVFHPLYKPYEELELDTRVRGKNALPAWTVLNMVAMRLGVDASIDQLEVFLKGIKNPQTNEHFEHIHFLNQIQHIAWGAGEIVYGVRAPGALRSTAESPDLIPYSNLGGSAAGLDEYTTLPVVNWVLDIIDGMKSE